MVWVNQRKSEPYHFIVGLGFAIAVVIVGRSLGFTLPTNNIKNRGKLINHTKQALPALR